MLKQPVALCLFCLALVLSTHVAGEDNAKSEVAESILLWPGEAPGEKGNIGEEHDSTKYDPNIPREKQVIRLTNVTKPSITLFKAPPDKDTGAAVIVCPGGGYHILAWDLEGTEICEWLNSIGVTGVLLKYRVPGREGIERHVPALQDAQRAVGMVRHRAKEWGINPNRIGILGFSAGGHLAAVASNNFGSRTYPAVDDTDKESCRPDFTVLIYPAYLTLENDLNRLSPELPVTADTPPALMMMTQDDPVKVESVYAYAIALKNVKVRAEVHVYPTGGHGYGLRPSPDPVSHWPQRAAEWMKSQGWLEKAPASK